MANVKQIFVGSSHEALPVVDLVRAIIERCGMAPLPWNDTSVSVPATWSCRGLSSCHRRSGGGTLATPDEASRRGDGEPIRVAVPNVVFEYAYSQPA